MNITVKTIKNGVKKSTTVNVDLSKSNCEGGAWFRASTSAIRKLGLVSANHVLERNWIDNTPALSVIKLTPMGIRELICTIKVSVSMRKIKSAFGE